MRCGHSRRRSRTYSRSRATLDRNDVRPIRNAPSERIAQMLDHSVGVASILTGIEPAIFDQYRANPEHFISEAARLIKEQKAGHLIEQLVYDPIDERYDADIFTAAEIGQDFSRATERLKNHVFDYCITDSGIERDFVGELDTSAEVEVYPAMPGQDHSIIIDVDRIDEAEALDAVPKLAQLLLRMSPRVARVRGQVLDRKVDNGPLGPQGFGHSSAPLALNSGVRAYRIMRAFVCGRTGPPH